MCNHSRRCCHIRPRRHILSPPNVLPLALQYERCHPHSGQQSNRVHHHSCVGEDWVILYRHSKVNPGTCDSCECRLTWTGPQGNSFGFIIQTKVPQGYFCRHNRLQKIRTQLARPARLHPADDVSEDREKAQHLPTILPKVNNITNNKTRGSSEHMGQINEKTQRGIWLSSPLVIWCEEIGLWKLSQVSDYLGIWGDKARRNKQEIT